METDHSNLTVASKLRAIGTQLCYGFGREADQSGGLLDDMFHPNKDNYPQQRIFVVSIGEYVYLVPYVETEEEIFLKTIICKNF